jgi:hypothetical protein
MHQKWQPHFEAVSIPFRKFPELVQQMSTTETSRPPNLRRAEAAEYLRQAHGVRLAAQTLAKLAVLGGGPPYFLDGRYPAYPIVDLDKFAIARLGRLRRSTSDDETADRAARGRTAAGARRRDAQQQD